MMKKVTEGWPGWWAGGEVGLAPCRLFPTDSVFPPPHRLLQARPPHLCPQVPVLPWGSLLWPSGQALLGQEGFTQPRSFTLAHSGLAHSTLIFHVDKPRPYPPLVVVLLL